MKVKAFKPVLWWISMLLLISMACSIASTPTPEAQLPTPEPVEATDEPAIVTEAPVAETEEPVVTEEPAASGAVSGLDDLKSAVIHLGVEGSTRDPYEGWQVNLPWYGSGFIVDPSGIAVTNNHVVTGAAQLQVYVGDDPKPRTAKVLGVSECSDIAVIDIEGDGYPYLEWYDGELKAGMHVYAAGYPGSAAGTAEYTLTEGIVSKPDTEVSATNFSVRSSIEHTARLNPGSSGGPLVDDNGRVVGVNNAGAKTTDENWAIHRDLAKSLVEELRAGKNIEAIGISGVAVSDFLNEVPVTGIWVTGVKSGSPADKARLQPGDVIVEMESKVMDVADLSSYCGILRSHDEGDTLSLTVIRADTMEYWTGQINGRELEYTGPVEGAMTSTTGETDPSQYASGDIFFDDEFDTDLSDWSYFLTSGDEDTVGAEASNNRLRLEFDDTYTWVYLINDTYEVDNVRIDTKAENLGRNNNNVSLICRYSDRGWYEFNIANNGKWYIYRYDPTRSGTDAYLPLASGGSFEINMGQDVNEYTAVCDGEDLTLGINGIEIKTVQDRVLSTGKAGLSVSSFNVTPIIIEVDYFTLSIP